MNKRSYIDIDVYIYTSLDRTIHIYLTIFISTSKSVYFSTYPEENIFKSYTQTCLSTPLPQDSFFMNFQIVCFPTPDHSTEPLPFTPHTLPHNSWINIDLATWHLSFRAKMNSFTDWHSAHWEDFILPLSFRCPHKETVLLQLSPSGWSLHIMHTVYTELKKVINQ